MLRRPGPWIGVALLLGASIAHAAPTPLPGLTYTPDITTVLGGQTVSPDGVADDNLQGTVTPVDFPGVPAGARISGYDLLADGQELIAFDITVALPGGVTAGPRDVVRFNGASYSLEFVGANNGVPSGASISALGTDQGKLLLSFDVTVNLPGLPAASPAGPRDIVRLEGPSSFSRVFDGTAAGVSPGLAIDGLHKLESNGHLLISFDGAGAVGIVSFFNQSAVLEFDPVGATWQIAYDGKTSPAAWPDNADLRDFASTPDSDGDGVASTDDNCISVFNPDQRDTNADGFGNACDPDFNQDNVVNAADLALLKSLFFRAAADEDLNGDGVVNAVDLATLKSRFFKPPGPSGLACAGTIPCPP